MATILLRIFTVFLFLSIPAAMVGVFLYTENPRFKARVDGWYKRLAPKVRKYSQPLIEDLRRMAIFLYDSFLNPILLVFASFVLFPDAYDVLRAANSPWDFYESLVWRSLMNPAPYFLFAFVFALWIIGYILKRGEETKERAALSLRFESVDKTLVATNTLIAKQTEVLARIESRLDQLKGGGKHG
jgi:hypothetical protein